MNVEVLYMDGLKKPWHAIMCSGGGANIEKIKTFEYIGSDISDLMNDGAENFHSGIKMKFSTKDTISGVISEIQNEFHKNLSLFYGLSVSVRYAVRNADDLVKVAELAELSVYNRLSVTFDEETLVNVYGTGKSVYIISLPKLVKKLKEKNFCAKYCTANMQREKDGKNTMRVSVVISRYEKMLYEFIERYDECINMSAHIIGVEKGEWKNLEDLWEDMMK